LGKSPYFLDCFFWVWQIAHVETLFIICSLILGQQKCWPIVSSVLAIDARMTQKIMIPLYYLFC
jgi:hypothetical protein